MTPQKSSLWQSVGKGARPYSVLVVLLSAH